MLLDVDFCNFGSSLFVEDITMILQVKKRSEKLGYKVVTHLMRVNE
jgi:hypothetical protein